jgi:hypothetical protein
MPFYCSRADITDILPTLTGSQIATDATLDAKCRTPAKDWVDSVYPGFAPFAPMSADWETAPVVDYLTNGEAESGDTTVGIDGGSGTPTIGDFVKFDGHNAIYKVKSWSSPTLGIVRVTTYHPGIEESSNTDGFAAVVLDNTPITFGTPPLLREAARNYGVNIAYQILRNNPLDEAAAQAMIRAMGILQVGNDNIARARPETFYENARDAAVAFNRFSPATARVVR